MEQVSYSISTGKWLWLKPVLCSMTPAVEYTGGHSDARICKYGCGCRLWIFRIVQSSINVLIKRWHCSVVASPLQMSVYSYCFVGSSRSHNSMATQLHHPYCWRKINRPYRWDSLRYLLTVASSTRNAYTLVFSALWRSPKVALYVSNELHNLPFIITGSLRCV